MAIQVRPAAADFEQKGAVEWQPNGWELDRLIVKKQGPRAKLDAFIAGLTLWSASDIDGNMFLSDFRNDDHPVHPTVDLIYIGKKGGVLPPDRNFSGYTEQQARFNVPHATGGTFYIQVTYTAPTTTKVVWGRTPVDVGTIAAATPVSATLIWFVTEWENVDPIPIPDSIFTAIAYFLEKESITGDSEEIVPGQYYRGNQTKKKLLFSKGT